MKMNLVLGAALGFASVAQADLLISGVMDGTLSGGQPKMVELYAITDIPDLSTYALARSSSGTQPFDPIDADYILPAIALSAGDFYYAVGNSFGDQTPAFDSIFPAYSGIRSRNFGVNSNGDDVTGLFYDPTGAFTGGESMVDVFGELGMDGTGTDWEHLDGWGYSNNGRLPSASFNVSDWMFSGPNAMDGLDAAGIAASFPDQTYVVPEPSTFALMALGLTAFALWRRRA